MRFARFGGLVGGWSKASMSGPQEKPIKAAGVCSRRIERVDPWDGVACTPGDTAWDSFGAVIGDDWKNIEKAKGRDFDSSRESVPMGAVGATGVA